MMYAIYQMKNDSTLHEYRFTSLERLPKGVVTAKNYDLIYKGYKNDPVSREQQLENLFFQFNMDRPANFHGHSLSVGDIVRIDGEFYYCSLFGWDKLDDFMEIEYTPVLEEVLRKNNGDDVTIDSWADWGTFKTMEEAKACKSQIIKDIKAGKYSIIDGNRYAFSVIVSYKEPNNRGENFNVEEVVDDLSEEIK